MFLLQLAVAVVSLLVGIATIAKESAPLVERAQENYRREESLRKATQISQMAIQWQYRGHDGTWRYYSDPTGRFWFRTNIEGLQEYCESPQYAAR